MEDCSLESATKLLINECKIEILETELIKIWDFRNRIKI